MHTAARDSPTRRIRPYTVVQFNAHRCRLHSHHLCRQQYTQLLDAAAAAASLAVLLPTLVTLDTNLTASFVLATSVQ